MRLIPLRPDSAKGAELAGDFSSLSSRFRVMPNRGKGPRFSVTTVTVAVLATLVPSQPSACFAADFTGPGGIYLTTLCELTPFLYVDGHRRQLSKGRGRLTDSDRAPVCTRPGALIMLHQITLNGARDNPISIECCWPKPVTLSVSAATADDTETPTDPHRCLIRPISFGYLRTSVRPK